MFYKNYPQYNFQHFDNIKVLKKPIRFRNTRFFMAFLTAGGIGCVINLVKLAYRKIDDTEYYQKILDEKIKERQITENFISFNNYYSIDLLEEFSQY